MPRSRLMLKSAAASAAPVEPPDTSASASPAATACAARTIEDSGLRARGGGRVGLLGDRQRGVDDLDPGPGGAELGGGTEQQDADALGGGDVRALGDLGGTEVGAVGVDGDDRHVMRLDGKLPVRAIDQRPDARGRHPPAILSARGRAPPKARRPRGRRTCRRRDRPDADGGGCGSAGTRCRPAPPSCAGRGVAPCAHGTASAWEPP